jgi:hypothetical protein
MFRRIAILAGAAFLASCGSGSSDDDDNGEKFRTTYGYYLSTGNTSLTSVIMQIMGDSDVALIQSQTNITQNANLGFIAGRVTDGAGAPLAAVTLAAHNDSGLAAGSIIYQSGVTFAYTPGLLATSSTGRFVVMNVPAGRVNIKCAAGADGNLYVRVEPGAAIYAGMSATASGVQPTWSGVTCNLIASGREVPGNPENAVNYQLLGTSSAPGPLSNLTTGAFDLGGVRARNTYLVKCTKAGFVDTHTYVQTVNANLTAGAGGGNVFITSTANRDNEINAAGVVLTAGTGIVTGRVMSGTGGFAVEARDGADQSVGVVRYGDNGDGGRPSAVLTTTQTDGIFYIYNLPPGQIFIRATSTDSAVSTYVDAFADGITISLDLQPQLQTQAVITISGALASLQGFAVPNGQVILHGLGVGDVSDQFGEYSMTNVPTRHLFIVRTSK